MGLIRRQSIDEKGNELWAGVDPVIYRALGGPLGRKNILIGPDEGAENFSLRIFEIPVGKHSKEEEHPHDHGVYIIQGKCRVLLGDKTHEVETGDVVWVQPNEHHRFDNVGDETLRFLCVIPIWGEQDAHNSVAAPQR